MRPRLLFVVLLWSAAVASALLLRSRKTSSQEDTWYPFRPASLTPWAETSKEGSSVSSAPSLEIIQLKGRLCSSFDGDDEDDLLYEGFDKFLDRLCLRGVLQSQDEAHCDATSFKVTIGSVHGQATTTISRLDKCRAKFELRVPFKDPHFSATLKDLPCELSAKVSLQSAGVEDFVEQELRESHFGFNFAVLMAHFARYLSDSVPVVDAQGKLAHCPMSLRGQLYMLAAGRVDSAKSSTLERIAAALEDRPVDMARIGGGNVLESMTKNVTVWTTNGPSLDVNFVDPFGFESNMNLALLRPFVQRYFQGRAIRWHRSVVLDFQSTYDQLKGNNSPTMDSSSATAVVIFCPLGELQEEVKQQLKMAYEEAVAADIPVVVALTHGHIKLDKQQPDEGTEKKLVNEALGLFSGYNPDNLVRLHHDEKNFQCCSCVKDALSVLHQAVNRVHAHRDSKYKQWLSQNRKGVVQAELAKGKERCCIDQVLANALDGLSMEDSDVKLDLLDCCIAKYSTLRPDWDHERVERTCYSEYHSRLSTLP